jgi:hypothetical protein
VGFFSSKLEFFGGDSPCFSPSNVAAAVDWYKLKLDCRNLTREEEEELKSDDPPVAKLALPGPELTCVYFYADPSGLPKTIPVIFCGNLEKTHRLLSERGVSCTAIQPDRSGRDFFEIQDLDGNKLEVCLAD